MGRVEIEFGKMRRCKRGWPIQRITPLWAMGSLFDLKFFSAITEGVVVHVKKLSGLTFISSGHS